MLDSRLFGVRRVTEDLRGEDVILLREGNGGIFEVTLQLEYALDVGKLQKGHQHKC